MNSTGSPSRSAEAKDKANVARLVMPRTSPIPIHGDHCEATIVVRGFGVTTAASSPGSRGSRWVGSRTALIAPHTETGITKCRLMVYVWSGPRPLLGLTWYQVCITLIFRAVHVCRVKTRGSGQATDTRPHPIREKLTDLLTRPTRPEP